MILWYLWDYKGCQIMGAYRDGNVSEWSRLDRSFNRVVSTDNYWNHAKRLKKELIPYVSLFVPLFFKLNRYLVFDRRVEDKDKETTNNCMIGNNVGQLEYRQYSNNTHTSTHTATINSVHIGLGLGVKGRHWVRIQGLFRFFRTWDLATMRRL